MTRITEVRMRWAEKRKKSDGNPTRSSATSSYRREGIPGLCKSAGKGRCYGGWEGRIFSNYIIPRRGAEGVSEP